MIESFGQQSTDTTCSLGGTTWSNPSDERIKTNITTSTAGLSLINDLRPVTFKYKTKGTLPATHREYEKDSTERLRNDTVNTGFIAQEIKKFHFLPQQHTLSILQRHIAPQS